MKKKIGVGAAIGVMALALAGPASAAAPGEPGCFGTDRAVIIDEVFRNGGLLDTSPGASDWGAIAAERGSTNGERNRFYRSFWCEGTPTQGPPNG